MQAYTIGLSINEDLKLEKGKGKNGSTARSYIQSFGHVTAIFQYRNVQVLPFSASAVTINVRLKRTPYIKIATLYCPIIFIHLIIYYYI